MAAELVLDCGGSGKVLVVQNGDQGLGEDWIMAEELVLNCGGAWEVLVVQTGD